MIIVRKLDSSDWQRFKELKLRALKEEPTNLAESFEEIVNKPDNYWQESIDGWFVAEGENQSLIGMICVEFVDKEKFRHRAHIKELYVAPEARRKGVAKSLLLKALDEIQNNPKIIRIDLIVSTTQAGAISLYEKFGFKIEGKIEKGIKVGKIFCDGYLMAKIIT